MWPSAPPAGTGAPAFPSLAELLARGPGACFEKLPLGESYRAFSASFNETYPPGKPLVEAADRPAATRPPIDHMQRVVEEMRAEKFGPWPGKPVLKEAVDARFSLVSNDSETELAQEEEEEEEADVAEAEAAAEAEPWEAEELAKAEEHERRLADSVLDADATEVVDLVAATPETEGERERKAGSEAVDAAVDLARQAAELVTDEPVAAQDDRESTGCATEATPEQRRVPEPGRKATEHATRSILRRRPDDSPLIANSFPDISASDDEDDDGGKTQHSITDGPDTRLRAGGLVFAYESDGSPLSRRTSAASRRSSLSDALGDEENVPATANVDTCDQLWDVPSSKVTKKRVSIAPFDLGNDPDLKGLSPGDVDSADAEHGGNAKGGETDGAIDIPLYASDDDDHHGGDFDDVDQRDEFIGAEPGLSEDENGRSTSFAESKRAPLAVIPLNLTVSISPESKVTAESSAGKQTTKNGPRKGRPAARSGGDSKTTKVSVPRREMRSLDVARARRALEREQQDNEGGEGVRRSNRQKFPVLKWWKSESIKYERRQSRLMPTIAQIELASSDSEEHVYAQPAARRRRKRTTSADNADGSQPRKRGRQAVDAP